MSDKVVSPFGPVSNEQLAEAARRAASESETLNGRTPGVFSAGYYRTEVGVRYEYRKRPSALQRIIVKRLLNWDWVGKT